MAMKLSSIGVLLFGLISSVWGHGYMIDPPSRNACYKVFPGKCPPNYTANEQNCGGRGTQIANSGKCGVCGDRYGIARHVAPGKYATGFITKTYKEGEDITARIHITANHQGWFEFRIGDIGTPPITQAKLIHLLKTPDGRTRIPLRGSGSSYETIKLRLPPGLTCKQCVLQWWWRVGNSWGCDAKGCGLGHGPQETFVNCADVQITSGGGVVPPPPTQAPPPPTQAPPPPTQAPPPPTQAPSPSTQAPSPPPPNTPPISPRPSTSPPPPTTNPPSPGGCQATGAWTGNPSIDSWCQTNCAVGYCPSHMCKCN